MAAVEKRLRISDQAFEPFELVVEFRSRLRVTVWQIQAADQQSVDGRFDIAAMGIGVAAGQAAPRFGRLRAFREYRDAVPRRLPMPDRAIARIAKLGFRKRAIGRLQFLQTGNIGLLFVEPFDERRQTRADAVDIESGELHESAQLQM